MERVKRIWKIVDSDWMSEARNQVNAQGQELTA